MTDCRNNFKDISELNNIYALINHINKLPENVVPDFAKILTSDNFNKDFLRLFSSSSDVLEILYSTPYQDINYLFLCCALREDNFFEIFRSGHTIAGFISYLSHCKNELWKYKYSGLTSEWVDTYINLFKKAILAPEILNKIKSKDFNMEVLAAKIPEIKNHLNEITHKKPTTAIENSNVDTSFHLFHNPRPEVLQQKYNDLFSRAVSNNNIKAAQDYLDLGADVNTFVVHSNAILYACTEGYFDMVKILLSNGADVKFSTKSNNTTLIAAARSGNNDLVDYILKKEVNINALQKINPSDYVTALDEANRLGYTAIVELLTKEGAKTANELLGNCDYKKRAYESK